MICKQCGREIPDHAAFCRYCGFQCAEPIVIPPERKPLPRWLLPAAAALLVLALIVGVAAWRLGRPAPAPEEPDVPTVTEPEPGPEPIEPEPIEYAATISGESHAEAGEKITLTASVTPELAITRTVWSSSDESIAKVEQGIVTCIAPGEVTIRVLIDSDEAPVLEAAFPFTVQPRPVAYRVAISPERMELRAGTSGTFTLDITADPAQEEIDAVIAWDSSDPRVAAVTDGRVQAVGEGEAQITARVSFPGGKLETVQAAVTVTSALSATPPSTGKPSNNTNNSNNSNHTNNTTTTTVKPTPPAPTPAPDPSKEADCVTTEDFYLANSDSAYLTVASLQKLTDRELVLARNEIYARHRRRFTTAWIQQYFDGKEWYEGKIAPNAFDPSVFNEFEDFNLKRILQIEAIRQAG